MFTFFRNLRRQNASKIHVGKNLKYALGEILLVVIGILLALQIDAWNSRRIDRLKARSYLEQIQGSLKEDTSSIGGVIRYNNRKIALIQNIISRMAKTQESGEYKEELLAAFPDLSGFFFLLVNCGAFENIMSNESIDIPENLELQKSLINYYQFEEEFGTQGRVKLISRDFTDSFTPLFASRERAKASTGIETNLPLEREISIGQHPEILFNMIRYPLVLNEHNELMEVRKVMAVEMLATADSLLTLREEMSGW